jgi:hypothetical protein
MIHDQARRLLRATIVNTSAGGLALCVESLPSSALIEVQIPKLDQSVELIVRNRTAYRQGHILGCEFRFPATAHILKALSGH